MKLPAGIISGLDAAINRYLRLDPETLTRLTRIDARCIAIELRGLDLMLYALPHSNGITLTDTYAGTPDTTISGTPIGLARVGLGRHKERALFSGAVEISGNIDAGRAFQDILEHIDIDWEEQLSQLTGDIVAHRLGNAVRHAGELFSKGRETVQHNTTEYLQEELRIVPARIEIENYCTDVMQLVMDVDRLAARVARLVEQTGTGEQT